MELDKEIEALKKEQQEVANRLLGANPQWCYLQGQIESLAKVKVEQDKQGAKK